MERFFKQGFVWITILVSLLACTSDVPSEIINEDMMEDILYDYHTAQALGKNSSDSINIKIRLYTDAVLKKYGISEKDFDSSIEWYTRHSERLLKIYKNLDERLAESASAHAGKVDDYVNMTSALGDTMNVWQEKNYFLLSSFENNHMSYEWQADSSIHKGDALMVIFNTQWLYRDGAKTAIMHLAVHYENDSVATVNRYIYTQGQQSMRMNTDKNLRIKFVDGFIYQVTEWADRPKILYISDFALVRLRQTSEHTNTSINSQETAPGNEEAHPGIIENKIPPKNKEARLRDSLLRNDTLEKNRLHFVEESENKSVVPRLHRRPIKQKAQ